jgi:beta-glucosidase/6-phospho-beta-glucosidase/beta-galactosidase
MATLRDDFIWGAATAAHQIEGGNTNSDFWVIEHSATSPGRRSRVWLGWARSQRPTAS